MSVRRARNFRKRMTPQEIALWFKLRELKVHGWHFRRQSPEPPYILDFVCRAAMLVVEVDGAQHASAEQSAHDERRDSVLRGRGFKVLRFWASDVERELDGVVEAIVAAVRGALPTRRASRDTLPVPGRDNGGARYRSLVRLGLRIQPDED
ncbi:MAG TPA: endonuclease domain-containing protein [Vitreimonas sp.]|nr:endonuclease domain-containing protein [Vitreimonas sp.]